MAPGSSTKGYPGHFYAPYQGQNKIAWKIKKASFWCSAEQCQNEENGIIRVFREIQILLVLEEKTF